MENYYLYNDRVDILMKKGGTLTIYFNENSGKVYFRYKINTISQIKHPGIFLGIDVNGQGYFLHNHYVYGKAVIVTENEFKKNMPIYIYNEKCSNHPIKVIEIGLNEVLRGESYKPATYNCQTYTNTACHNKRQSEDTDKWMGRILVGSLILLGLGAAFNGGGRRK